MGLGKKHSKRRGVVRKVGTDQGGKVPQHQGRSGERQQESQMLQRVAEAETIKEPWIRAGEMGKRSISSPPVQRVCPPTAG